METVKRFILVDTVKNREAIKLAETAKIIKKEKREREKKNKRFSDIEFAKELKSLQE